MTLGGSCQARIVRRSRPQNPRCAVASTTLPGPYFPYCAHASPFQRAFPFVPSGWVSPRLVSARLLVPLLPPPRHCFKRSCVCALHARLRRCQARRSRKLTFLRSAPRAALTSAAVHIVLPCPPAASSVATQRTLIASPAFLPLRIVDCRAYRRCVSHSSLRHR